MSTPISSFGSNYQVDRYAAGSFDSNGEFVKGAMTTLEINAVIQPMKPNEAILLPEHRRTKDAIRVYSETKLRTTDEKAKTPADVVHYNGKRYEIIPNSDWASVSFLQHYKQIAVKIDGEGGG